MINKENNNQSIRKIMRVLRNNNVIIKKVIPSNNNFLTKIKKSSVICNNSNEKIYIQEYKDSLNYKKTDEYDDVYSSNMLKNYHELLDRLDDTNTFCDVILLTFISVCAISVFIIIFFIQLLVY